MNTDRFKFRAWDTHCNRMRYEEDYARVPDTGKPHWIHDQEFLQGEATQLILMQCTGLKDMNGQLIYEGDIIECGGFTRTILWENGRFVAVHIEQDYVYCLEYNMKTVPVIGNIYEGIQE